jgi:hypothetical protein
MSHGEVVAKHFKRRREFFGIEERESVLNGIYYYHTGDKERDTLIAMALTIRPMVCPNGCKDPLFKDSDNPELRDQYLMEPIANADRVEYVCYVCGKNIQAPFFKYRKHDMEIRIAEGEFRK